MYYSSYSNEGLAFLIFGSIVIVGAALFAIFGLQFSSICLCCSYAANRIDAKNAKKGNALFLTLVKNNTNDDKGKSENKFPSNADETQKIKTTIANNANETSDFITSINNKKNNEVVCPTL